MTEKNYENLNAEVVYDLLEKYIQEMENDMNRYHCKMPLSIRKVCKDLGIFDWWKEYLSLSDLKNMHKFIGTAMELGFRGYVCFKVGASGCANGMWCHTETSTDGYSPDSDFIYRSFTPDYTEWDAMIKGELFFAHKTEKGTRTLRNLKKKLKEKVDSGDFVPHFKEVKIEEPTQLTTYNVGYTTPHDTFTETQFDAESMTDLFNLFLDYAKENNFLDNELKIDYIERV